MQVEIPTPNGLLLQDVDQVILVGKTAVQLAMAPTSVDLALGPQALFYDIAAVPNVSNPPVRYIATATAFVPQSGGASLSSAQQALGAVGVMSYQAAAAAAANAHAAIMRDTLGQAYAINVTLEPSGDTTGATDTANLNSLAAAIYAQMGGDATQSSRYNTGFRINFIPGAIYYINSHTLFPGEVLASLDGTPAVFTDNIGGIGQIPISGAQPIIFHTSTTLPLFLNDTTRGIIRTGAQRFSQNALIGLTLKNPNRFNSTRRGDNDLIKLVNAFGFNIIGCNVFAAAGAGLKAISCNALGLLNNYFLNAPWFLYTVLDCNIIGNQVGGGSGSYGPVLWLCGDHDRQEPTRINLFFGNLFYNSQSNGDDAGQYSPPVAINSASGTTLTMASNVGAVPASNGINWIGETPVRCTTTSTYPTVSATFNATYSTANGTLTVNSMTTGTIVRGMSFASGDLAGLSIIGFAGSSVGGVGQYQLSGTPAASATASVTGTATLDSSHVYWVHVSGGTTINLATNRANLAAFQFLNFTSAGSGASLQWGNDSNMLLTAGTKNNMFAGTRSDQACAELITFDSATSNIFGEWLGTYAFMGNDTAMTHITNGAAHVYRNGSFGNRFHGVLDGIQHGTAGAGPSRSFYGHDFQDLASRRGTDIEGLQTINFNAANGNLAGNATGATPYKQADMNPRRFVLSGSMFTAISGTTPPVPAGLQFTRRQAMTMTGGASAATAAANIMIPAKWLGVAVRVRFAVPSGSGPYTVTLGAQLGYLNVGDAADTVEQVQPAVQNLAVAAGASNDPVKEMVFQMGASDNFIGGVCPLRIVRQDTNTTPIGVLQVVVEESV